MPIFTKEEFAKITEQRSGSRGLKGVVSEFKAQSKSTQTTSIFLSHCHTDKNIVEQVVVFLRTLNATIYIDWMDETMPEKTSGETAVKIKTRIRSNDKFILLATNTAIASKWCNWELGIADMNKLSSDKMCLLPLADNQRQWEGNEYMQIYPFIEKHTTHENIFNLTYPDGGKVWFDEWLKK